MVFFAHCSCDKVMYVVSGRSFEHSKYSRIRSVVKLIATDTTTLIGSFIFQHTRREDASTPFVFATTLECLISTDNDESLWS